MKKIPTLFERVFENHKVVGITDKVTPGMEWVLKGEGVATVKIDGACCAIIGGELYKRYDAKKGKQPPADAIPCCEPDSVTGHWPHWVPVKADDPADKWFNAAWQDAADEVYGSQWFNPLTLADGTYEAVGPHFQGNPENLSYDTLIAHGIFRRPDVVRTFEGIRDYLESHGIEGLVFWKDGEPQCKIKRSDFGFPWPVKRVGGPDYGPVCSVPTAEEDKE